MLPVVHMLIAAPQFATITRNSPTRQCCFGAQVRWRESDPGSCPACKKASQRVEDFVNGHQAADLATEVRGHFSLGWQSPDVFAPVGQGVQRAWHRGNPREPD